MNFRGPDSGRNGTLSAKGTIDASGTIYDISQRVRFSRQRFSIDRLAPIIQDDPSPSGRVFISKRTIRGNDGTIAPGLVIKMKVSLVKTRRRAKLVLTHTVNSGGVDAYVYTYTGRARLRPTD